MPNSVVVKELSDTSTMRNASGKVRARKQPRTSHVLPNRQFRSVASRLLALRESGTSKTIGIASCGVNEGNSTVASNLAVALSHAIEGEVLLIDCVEPVRRSIGPGWFDFVFGNADLVDIVRETDTPRFFSMSAGNHLEPGDGTYNRSRMINICQLLKEHFEFVLFDLPCAEHMTGCFPIASVLDGVLLNIKAGKVNSAKAVQMQKEMQIQGAHILGAVLNQTESYVPGFLRMFLRTRTSSS